MQEIFNYIH